MGAPMSAPLSPDPAAGPVADQGSGFTIEIEVAADGTMTGSIESSDQESDEGADGGPDDSGQPLASLADALTFVKDAIANQGQVSQAASQDPDTMSDQDVWDQGAKQRASAPA